MEKFQGTRTLAGIFVILGWVAVALGALILFAPEAPKVLGAASIGSGLTTILLAQAVMVLLAIEENTRPPTTTGDKARDPKTNLLDDVIIN